ncbi:MAG: sigma-70 family RNA polymerase sigma factor, partial [Thermomicrobium sp.]|nr:sigma-70 family RNA polymerase sigma factor [Thermomicrobium sp.]
LRTRRVHGSVRAWLFTIARNAAIDHLRRQRTTPFSHLVTAEGEEWEPDLPATGPEAQPDETARRSELAELVWQAARGLNPSDYALLDLSLRHDLTPVELAQVIGVRRGAINTRLSRLRDALEEGLTTLLLARWGRRDCPELDEILGSVELPAGLTPQVRRAVARHVERCAICQKNRRKVVSAADLLPALAPILPSTDVRAGLDAVIQRALATPAPSGLGATLSTWRHWLLGSGVGKAVLGAAVLMLAVGVGAGWFAFGTTTVTVTTRDCPPLALHWSGVAATGARLFNVPERFVPGEAASVRLPAGAARVDVRTEGAVIRLAGLPVELRFAVLLRDVRWDGEPLLGRGQQTLVVRRGVVHTLELVCQ